MNLGPLWERKGGCDRMDAYWLFLNAFEEVVGLVGRRDGGFRVDGRFPPCFQLSKYSHRWKQERQDKERSEEQRLQSSS